MKDVEDYQSVRSFVSSWSIAMRVIRMVLGAVTIYFGVVTGWKGDFVVGAVLLALGEYLDASVFSGTLRSATSKFARRWKTAMILALSREFVISRSSVQS